MEENELLPLGSIVIAKGNIKKIMIISRGLALPVKNELQRFDYGGCLYPEGLMGEALIYFNHEDIAKKIFQGFSDDDNIMMLDNLNEAIKKSNLAKGKPNKLMP